MARGRSVACSLNDCRCRSAGAVEITEQTDLGSVVDLLVDQDDEDATGRPLDAEVGRPHLLQPGVVQLAERRRDRTLALLQVFDGAGGVAVRCKVPEVAHTRAE